MNKDIKESMLYVIYENSWPQGLLLERRRPHFISYKTRGSQGFVLSKRRPWVRKYHLQCEKRTSSHFLWKNEPQDERRECQWVFYKENDLKNFSITVNRTSRSLLWKIDIKVFPKKKAKLKAKKGISKKVYKTRTSLYLLRKKRISRCLLWKKEDLRVSALKKGT